MKKPIFKRWWFWVIVVLVIGAVGNAVGGDTADAHPTSSVYRGTLPSQKPSQAPAQTEELTPEETNEPAETEMPSPALTPEPTQATTPVPVPTQSQGGSPSGNGTSGGGSGDGSNFQTWDNPSQQQTSDNWVLNTSSMKIHYPSCSSVPNIAPQNYSTSNASLDELLSRGYSRCGRCFG